MTALFPLLLKRRSFFFNFNLLDFQLWFYHDPDPINIPEILLTPSVWMFSFFTLPLGTEIDIVIVNTE